MTDHDHDEVELEYPSSRLVQTQLEVGKDAFHPVGVSEDLWQSQQLGHSKEMTVGGQGRYQQKYFEGHRCSDLQSNPMCSVKFLPDSLTVGYDQALLEVHEEARCQDEVDEEEGIDSTSK